MSLSHEDIANKAVIHAIKLGCQYCDVRYEVTKRKGFVIENGQIDHSTSKKDAGFGIRVLNQGSWGFCSLTKPKSKEEVIQAVEIASKGAKHISVTKEKKVKIVDAPSIVDTVYLQVKKKPEFKELIQLGFDCDQIIRDKKRIIKSFVHLWQNQTEKFFINSEGSKIDQKFCDVIAELSATAHEYGLTQTVSITEGGRGGMETITDNQKIEKASEKISTKAAELIDASAPREEKCKVILNPDFVSLLTHEILGHPSEADRVLGKEMAWAGGAWWAGKIGCQIGSENLNVFDDPTISSSLGSYKYDDEGIRASKTSLIENGKLVRHMQSRETAEIFKTNATGNMRASAYRFMPLIRMACTCIDKGDWNPEEMIRETKNGILVHNMKIPSIDMERNNWSISCQYAQKIENGEPKELLRDVIVTGNAPEFFNSIDACGKDFIVRPITNCGKGDPIQSMLMGNGGPTVRGIATIKSI